MALIIGEFVFLGMTEKILHVKSKVRCNLVMSNEGDRIPNDIVFCNQFRTLKEQLK